jgi:hypothetical protein
VRLLCHVDACGSAKSVQQYQTSDWNQVETTRLFSRGPHSLLISQHYRTVPTPSVSALHVVPPRPCPMGCTTGVASSGKTCIQPRCLPTSGVGVQGKGTVNKTFGNPPLSLGPHLSRGSASHRRRRRKLTEIPTSKEPRWSTLWRIIGPGGEAQDEVKTPMVSAPPFRGDLGKFCLSQFRVPRDSSEFERLGRSAGSHYRVSLLAIRNACRVAFSNCSFEIRQWHFREPMSDPSASSEQSVQSRIRLGQLSIGCQKARDLF